MKTIKALLLVIMVSAAVFKVSAQQGMEDVVYLKNGSIYRGLIIEQVPNTSLKIQTMGGSVMAVNLTDVTKITKENKIEDREFYHFGPMGYGHFMHQNDSGRHEMHIRSKGYFFQAQLLIENLQGGVRIINGYKFNTHAALGIGVGVDFVMNAPFARPVGISRNDYSGTYMPLYLYLTGDVLKRRITPFYAVEAGVTMGHLNNGNRDGMFTNPSDFTHNLAGGPMGAVGFGVKFYTRRKVNLSLLADMNVKALHYFGGGGVYDVNGNFSDKALLVFPGIRFGVGF